MLLLPLPLKNDVSAYALSVELDETCQGHDFANDMERSFKAILRKANIEEPCRPHRRSYTAPCINHTGAV